MKSLLNCPLESCYRQKYEQAMNEAGHQLDARGLSCPLPLLKAKQALNRLQSGERLEVLATDAGSVRDFEVFARQSGHTLLSSSEREGVYTYLLQKK